MHVRTRSALTVSVAAALVLAACSDSDDGQAEIDEANAAAAAAAAEVETLTAELDDAAAEVERSAGELADAETANRQLAAETAAETERADAAEEQLQSITELFPFEVESTLAGIELDLAGTYSIKWAEAYCDTFATCGTLPSVTEATFVRTADDFLRVQVAGILDAGLFAIDGSLYGIT